MIIKKIICLLPLKKIYILIERICSIIPDDIYIKMIYRFRVRKKLNLDNPQTYNEKLNWLKLYNQKAEYTRMVDKYAVKEYVAQVIGEQYVIPTLGVWDKFEDIDFCKLPNRFVLKCTHDSSGIIICRDKFKLDLKKTKNKIKTSLKRDYFLGSREWPYKNVPRRIIVEEYMEEIEDCNKEDDKKMLDVYKIFCFSGKPELFQVVQNDKTDFESIDYFDTSWNKLDLRQNFPNSDVTLSKPEKIDEMIDVAKKLSQGIPFVRIDLYQINKRVYFSEMTFFSDAGFAKFEPEEWDYKLGQMINLPTDKIIENIRYDKKTRT